MEPRLDVGLYSCLVSDSVCTKFLLLGIPGNIPVLTRDEGHPGSYVARFDVDVYAFDETKSQVFHAATQRTIVSPAKGDRSHEAPPPMYITRISLDTLPPRARTLQLIVEDRSSSRTIQHTVPLPARLSSRFSSLFVVDTSRAADRFELASVGNVVPFGGNIRLLMQVRQGGSSLAQLSGRLTPVHPLPNASAIPAPTLQALGERSLSVVTGDSNVVLTPVTDPRCDAELVLLDISATPRGKALQLPLIREIAGPSVAIIDPSAAIARELRRRLADAGLLSHEPCAGTERFWSSAMPDKVQPVISQLWRAGIEVWSLPDAALPE